MFLSEASVLWEESLFGVPVDSWLHTLEDSIHPLCFFVTFVMGSEKKIFLED
jgi:hypothetical protein